MAAETLPKTSEFHPFRRWLILHFPGLVNADSHDRLLAKMWSSLYKTQPPWYRPVLDVFTPEFRASIAELRDACEKVAAEVHLKSKVSIPSGYLPVVRQQLIEDLLARHQLTPEQLKLTAPLDAAARATLVARVASLPHSSAHDWDLAYTDLVALLHLCCHPWDELHELYPTSTSPPKGLFMADQLLDLYYVAKPIQLGPMMDLVLKAAYQQVDLEKLKPLRQVLAKLFDGDRFSVLVRGILADAEFPLRKASYHEGNLEAEIRQLLGEFESEIRFQERQDQRKGNAQKVEAAFAGHELAVIPMYNQLTNDFLLSKRLPELNFFEGLQILESFRIAYDEKLFRPVFQRFQLEIDFIKESDRREFREVLVPYFKLIEMLTKFCVDFASSSQSPLIQIDELMQQKFTEGHHRDSPQLAISRANDRAELVCSLGLSSLKALQTLLLGYQADATAKTPRYFSLDPSLHRRTASVFAQLDKAMMALDMVLSLMLLVMPDTEK